SPGFRVAACQSERSLHGTPVPGKPLEATSSTTYFLPGCLVDIALGLYNRRGAMRVGVDIGGTFTDVVVFDESASQVSLAKALSTPATLARGVREALAKSGAALADTSSLIHGSTVVINAIIERQGARTALLTTRGFRDVYEIGRINRPDAFNPRFKKH